jgi:hypothetical protein
MNDESGVPRSAFGIHTCLSSAAASTHTFGGFFCPMNMSLKRSLLLFFLLTLALSCLSCSFTNNFVVVNGSRAVLEVSYHVKNPTDPRAPTRLYERAPETKPRSQIGEQVAWQPLPSSRYKIDSDNRVVVLKLNPDEALLLTQCRPANGASSGDCEPESFHIDEITLVGTNGETKLRGEQAHRSFVRDRNTFTLTYY